MLKGLFSLGGGGFAGPNVGRKGGMLRGAFNMTKGLGKLGIRGLALGASGLASGASALASGVASLGGGAAALAAANPITATVLVGGAVAYGGYKLYKYYSDRKEPTPFEKIRFLQYGANLGNKDELALFRQLEDEVGDKLTWSGNVPSLSEPPQYFVEEFAQDFGVQIENQQEVEYWAYWFAKRFVPVYLRWVGVAKAMDITDEIDDIEDEISEDKKGAFLSAIVNLSQMGQLNPMKVNHQPWPYAQVRDVTQEVQALAKKYSPDVEIKSSESINPKTEMTEKTVQAVSGDSVKTLKTMRKAAIPSQPVKLPKATEPAKTKVTTSAIVKSMDAVQSGAARSEEIDKAILADPQVAAAVTLQQIRDISNYASSQRNAMIQLLQNLGIKLEELILITMAADDVTEKEINEARSQRETNPDATESNFSLNKYLPFKAEPNMNMAKRSGVE